MFLRGLALPSATLPSPHPVTTALRTAPDPDTSRALVLDLARALQRRGVPSHRLEAAVSRVGSALGHDVLVFATPTAVQIAFETAGAQQMRMLREETGPVDLGKVCALNELIDDLTAGLNADQARSRLAEIERSRSTFGPASTALAFGVASASASCMFGGGPAEVATSGVLGLLVGALSFLADRHPSSRALFEPAAALLAVCVAGTLAAVVPISAHRVALASVIALVPGFTLTVALSELAVRHLASGVARLAGAITTFLAIGLGVGVGSRLIARLPDPALIPEPRTPTWIALAVSVAAGALAFAVLFQARTRDVVWLVLSGSIAFVAARAGAVILGSELGVFVGALAVGSFSNLLARARRMPATVPQVPGIMLLVPGSIGYNAVSMLLIRDVISGVETAFLMFLVAISIVGGLLAANVLVPPRREL